MSEPQVDDGNVEAEAARLQISRGAIRAACAWTRLATCGLVMAVPLLDFFRDPALPCCSVWSLCSLAFFRSSLSWSQAVSISEAARSSRVVARWIPAAPVECTLHGIVGGC